MNTLNILIVEDEGLIAWDLKKQLTKVGYQVVGPYNNGKEALDAFANETIDLALLDIHIQGQIDGIEVATAIRKISNIPLIFLTAMASKAFVERAKQVNPSAYLLKPYQVPALHIAIEVAFANFDNHQAAILPYSQALPQAQILDESTEANAKLGKEVFLVQQGFAIIKPQKVFVKINIQDIFYLKADHVYTEIYTASQTYLLRAPIQKILEKLSNYPFQKIHRSYVVNMAVIERFDEENVYLCNQSLPIGKTHKADFMTYFLGR